MPRKPAKSYPAFKKALDNGSTLTDAKLAAGYTYNVARMGRHQLPKRFLRMVEKQQQKFSSLSISHDAAAQEHAVRGALLANLYEGKDRAVQSAKLLGQDKRVNMFTADNQIGVIVLQPPAGLLTELQQRIIEANPVTITSGNVTPSDE